MGLYDSPLSNGSSSVVISLRSSEEFSSQKTSFDVTFKCRNKITNLKMPTCNERTAYRIMVLLRICAILFSVTPKFTCKSKLSVAINGDTNRVRKNKTKQKQF